jgi:hypothetical protein
MTISCQVVADAQGVRIPAQAMVLEAWYQAIIRDVPAVSGFWGDAGSTAFQQSIIRMRRNFEMIYEQANAQEHGAGVQTVGSPHGQHRHRSRFQLGLTRRADRW